MTDQQRWETILKLCQQQDISLGSEMEKLARIQSDKPAIIYNDQILSYAGLNSLANRYASFFNTQGFKKGDVVALFMENRPEYLAAITGLSKLGVVVALLNTGIRGQVLAREINLCEARSVIVGHELLDIFQDIAPRLRLREPAAIYVNNTPDDRKLGVNMQALDPLLLLSSEENPGTTQNINSKDCLAYVFTAGRSGLRKGVAVSQQRWLINGHILSLLGQMNEATVQYACMPLHFNTGVMGVYAGMIMSGSTMVLRQRFSVGRFWDDIRSCGANYMIAVAEICRYLYNQTSKPDDHDNPLEVMLCYGVDGDLIEPFCRRFGLKHLIEVYAKSEGVGSFINYEEVMNMCGNLSLRGRRQGEVVQYDLHNDTIKTDDKGRVLKCQPGQAGLLLCEINELNPFNGYINDPEATEDSILHNVFLDGDQYLHSGDLVQLYEKDYISFVDRLGDTYRWKSMTVSASAVADVIKKFYGAIEDAVVYAVKIPGVEGSCGMAAVKLLEDEPLDWAGFVKYINERMPEHARPVFIRLVSFMEGDDGIKQLKEKYREEGYNPQALKDQIFFLDPIKNRYVPLNMDLYEQILAQKIAL